MPIDASIYQNQPQAPSVDPLTSAERAMSLGQMGLQMQTQQAMRQAYADNTDAHGNVNRQGVLAAVARINPMYSGQLSQQYAAQDKAQSEAHLAQLQDLHQTVSTGLPHLEYALNFAKQNPDKPEQIQEMWTNVRKTMADQKLPINNLPEQFDQKPIQYIATTAAQQKEGLENQLLKANIGKTQAEAGNVFKSAVSKAQENMRASPEYQTPNNSLQLGGQLLSTLDQSKSNRVAAAQLPEKLAEFVTNGKKIAPEERGAVLANIPIFEKGSEEYNKLMKGTITPDMYDKIRDYATGQLTTLKSQRDDAIQAHANAFAANYGGPPEFARQLFTGEKPGKEDGSVSPSMVAGTQGSKGPNQPQKPGFSPLGKNANADEKQAGPPLPKGMIRIKGPDGRIFRVPESQKGQAIEAGGSVVK